MRGNVDWKETLMTENLFGCTPPWWIHTNLPPSDMRAKLFYALDLLTPGAEGGTCIFGCLFDACKSRDEGPSDGFHYAIRVQRSAS